MLLSYASHYVSDLDSQAHHRRVERAKHSADPYVRPHAYHYLERPEAMPPAEPLDVARRQAFRARCENRGYAEGFVGPIYTYPGKRLPTA